MACFSACLLAGFVGCADVSPGGASLRRVFVEDTARSPSPSLARSADVIHDTAVRTLLRHGYLAAAEPAEADAFLRSAWHSAPADAGLPDGRVSLRMTLVGRDGTRHREFEVIAAAPARFLTDERIADLVRAKLDANLP